MAQQSALQPLPLIPNALKGGRCSTRVGDCVVTCSGEVRPFPRALHCPDYKSASPVRSMAGKSPPPTARPSRAQCLRLGTHRMRPLPDCHRLRASANVPTANRPMPLPRCQRTANTTCHLATTGPPASSMADCLSLYSGPPCRSGLRCWNARMRTRRCRRRCHRPRSVLRRKRSLSGRNEIWKQRLIRTAQQSLLIGPSAPPVPHPPALGAERPPSRDLTPLGINWHTLLKGMGLRLSSNHPPSIVRGH